MQYFIKLVPENSDFDVVPYNDQENLFSRENLLSLSMIQPKKMKRNIEFGSLTENVESGGELRRMVKRNPACIRKCLQRRLLHPAQCHFLC